MKKVFTVIAILLSLSLLASCGGTKEKADTKKQSDIKNTYISHEVKDLDGDSCIAVYTEFENNSDETVEPSDVSDMKAYQNGVEIDNTVLPNQDITDAVNCDTEVRPDTKTKVMWSWIIKDTSQVTLVFSDGHEKKIDLE